MMENDRSHGPPSAHFDINGGNPRIATRMQVIQSGDTLILETRLYGLELGTVNVTFEGPYFIVEGTLASTSHRGRYARHVPELAHGPYDLFNMEYAVDGKLVLEARLRKKTSDV